MVQWSRCCTSCWHSKVLGSNPIHDTIFLRVNWSFSKYINWTFQNMPIKDKMIRSLRNQGKYSQYVHNLAPEWSGHCFNLFRFLDSVLFHMELDLSIQRFLVQIHFFFVSTGQIQSGRDHPKHADQINDNTQQRNQAQNSTNGHHHLTPEWSANCFRFRSFFCWSLFRFLVWTPRTLLIFNQSICINIITSLNCFFV